MPTPLTTADRHRSQSAASLNRADNRLPLPVSGRFGPAPAVAPTGRLGLGPARHRRRLAAGPRPMFRIGPQKTNTLLVPACRRVAAVGEPDGGIEPGVAFEDVPDDWRCPVCGVGKDMFELLE